MCNMTWIGLFLDVFTLDCPLLAKKYVPPIRGQKECSRCRFFSSFDHVNIFKGLEIHASNTVWHKRFYRVKAGLVKQSSPLSVPVFTAGAVFAEIRCTDMSGEGQQQSFRALFKLIKSICMFLFMLRVPKPFSDGTWHAQSTNCFKSVLLEMAGFSQPVTTIKSQALLL